MKRRKVFGVFRPQTLCAVHIYFCAIRSGRGEMVEYRMPSLIAVPRMSQRHNLRNREDSIKQRVGV